MTNQTNGKIPQWEKDNARALAVRTLEKVQNGAYSNLQLNAIIKKSELDGRDVAFMTNLVYGVIQHRLTLTYWLKDFVAKPEKLDPWVRELLLISIFQMVYMDKVPKHAIFDEAIELAKRRGHAGLRKFVTGVLHAIDRKGLSDFSEITDLKQRLSVQYSMPEWLVETFLNDYGQERTEQLLTSVNEAPKQSARVNTVVTTVDEAIEMLTDEGFTVERSTVSPVGLLLSGGHVASSNAFGNGLVTLQDESAMLMAPALTIQPSMHVLDAAAAPGGKTTQIATYLDPAQGGKVTALDIHEHKVALIDDNAARLSVTAQVDARLLDARKVDEVFADETFDRILVDAPCSGFGLLRRKPEIRYDKSIEDSKNLQRIQLAILDAVAQKVKVDGDIVYGTCTILQIENSDVVKAFLAAHDNFELVPTELEYDLDVRNSDGSVQILPDDFGSDGFFIATLRRTK